MALTSAERQAKYRASRATAGDNGERRLSMWIATGTDSALARLAHRYTVTKRQMLERLIAKAEDEVLSTLDVDSPEWHAYMKA
ncbi:hypothetical protein AWV80_25815 [Cupriavidus sp. UYMU48A]|nr:hypothetical protein AWV80_25815 [Cupriavidus sp. UYMU48A]